MKEETETLVCIDIGKRAVEGRCKYSTTVADNPLPLRQWLQHAYEEALDLAIYLRRAMQEMDGENKPAKKPKWRPLESGEMIEDGDQLLGRDDRWRPTDMAGRNFNPYIDNNHRRRVTPDLSELSNHINELLKHE